MTDSNSIVIQGSDGHYRPWRFRSLAELQRHESDLEEAIFAHPVPLVIDQLELLPGRIAKYRQRVLPSGKKPDVILLTEHGDVVIVEVKRSVNEELRKGREAIAQVVEYAATLSLTDEDHFVRSLTNKQNSSWEQLCRHEFSKIEAPNKLARKFRQRVADGDIHLVIACDQAPENIAEMVRAVSNLSSLGFGLHVIEVRPMVADSEVDAEIGSIAWVPVLRLDTKIVHRTSVTIRTEGFSTDNAPSINVDAKSESADEIKRNMATARRSPRKSQAQTVLSPLAEELNLTVGDLWDELGSIHQAALVEDWSELKQAIASLDDAGTNLRGHQGFVEGRYGVNLLERWVPSVFVGAYFLDVDHRQRLLAPDTGGDFALILDVEKDKRKAFGGHKCFTRLRMRLRENSQDWDFADHYAQDGANMWHPLHLRRPLRDVLADASTSDERKTRWLGAARDAVKILLEGGELAELRRREEW